MDFPALRTTSTCSAVFVMFPSDEGSKSTLETLDFACFLYRQYANVLYFDLYFNTAHATHYAYFTSLR